MKRLIARYHRWKDWCIYTINTNKLYQIAVLLGILHDDTFNDWWMP